MNHFSLHKLINRLVFVLLGLTVLALTACQSHAPATPTPLTAAEGTDGFQNFAWLLDGTAVYFNFGRTELWKYEVATNALTLIASTEPSE